MIEKFAHHGFDGFPGVVIELNTLADRFVWSSRAEPLYCANHPVSRDDDHPNKNERQVTVRHEFLGVTHRVTSRLETQRCNGQCRISPPRWL